MDKITLTAKTASVLSFLQANDGPYFGDEIAEAVGLNPRGIHGVLNSLVKNGLIDKSESERTILVDGNDVTRAFKAYTLTTLGQSFDVEAATIDAE
jgi:predicted ArsR family transcriptional regulator